MKKTIIILSAAALLSAGCSKDCERVSPVPTEETATIFLIPSAGDMTAVTRSSLTAGESELKTLQIVVTDSDGKVAGDIWSETGDVSGLSFTGIAGHAYKVWAAANLGERVSVDKLSDFTSGQRSASLDDVNSDGIPMFSEGGGIGFTMSAAGGSVSIPLTRMLARIDLSVDTSGLPSGSFAVSGATVRSGVSSYAVFTDTWKQPSDGSTSESFDSASSNDIASLNRGEVISLYAFENMQGTLLPGNSDPWKKVPENAGSTADDCSWLEVKASYSCQGLSSDDITYRMYLGADATTNFDVERNHVYRVTLVPSEDEIFGDRGSWKIESTGWDDSRTLRFSSPSVTMTALGTATVTVIRTPSDLDYDLSATGLSETGLTYSASGDVITINSGEDISSAVTASLHIETPDGVHHDDCLIKVIPRTVLTGISITPENATISVGETKTYKVNASFSDGTTADVTSESTITTSDSSKASVGGSTVTGESAGTVTISAEYGGKIAQTVLTVVDDVSYELVITPGTVVLEEGETAEFSAILYTTTNGDSDSGTDVTDEADWSITSGDEYISSTGTEGQFRWSGGPGSATVMAVYDGLSATAEVTTEAHVPDISYEIVISPSETVLEEGESVSLTATLYTLSDGVRDSGTDVTSSASWSVTSGSAYVSSKSKGKYTWKDGPGTATVRASYMDEAGTAEIRTEAHHPDITYEYSIILLGDDVTVKKGQTAPVSRDAEYVILTYEDGVLTDEEHIPVKVTLYSENKAVATVSGSTVTGVSGGMTELYGMYGSMRSENTIGVTVTEDVISYFISITPVSASLEVGESQQFRATYYTVTNGLKDSGRDVTAYADWSSNAPGGKFTATEAGSFTVTATYMGESDSVTVTVEDSYIIVVD